MKKLNITLCLTVMLLIASNISYSQSAVYFCTETGAFGYAYGYSYADALTHAYNTCIDYGGTNPQLVVSTEETGYGAIALGTNSTGNRVIGAALGFGNLEKAKTAAINSCKKSGGRDVYIYETFYDGY
ncbi:MAG TPA: DUF4189 domain-containing protein [Ignavibacteria bacterium]|nr:DUF4189 domain-containing protein [Ignavibacteria bacterium]